MGGIDTIVSHQKSQEFHLEYCGSWSLEELLELPLHGVEVFWELY